MTVKKLAIFVEGQTESIFTKKLLEEIAGKKFITFEQVRYQHLRILKNDSNDDENKYFVLIVDCENDESVKSRILENRDNLIRKKYELVLGLRDLYPRQRDKLSKVLMALHTGVPTKFLRIELCLAVMEVEAWFLQEENHYQLIDDELTLEKIVDGVGFNPEKDDAELVDSPAELLRDIYRLVGKSYTKSRKNVERTVNVLDYENLYLNIPDKSKHLKEFLGYLDEFLV